MGDPRPPPPEADRLHRAGPGAVAAADAGRSRHRRARGEEPLGGGKGGLEPEGEAGESIQ